MMIMDLNVPVKVQNIPNIPESQVRRQVLVLRIGIKRKKRNSCLQKCEIYIGPVKQK